MAYRYKEDEKENKRIYYLRNRDIILKRAREWNIKHSDKVKIHRLNYKNRLTRGY